MKTRFVLLAAIILSLAALCMAQDAAKTDAKMMKPNGNDQALMMMEKTAWQNLVDKKYDDFAKMFAADYQGVYAQGIYSFADELSQVKQMTFKSAEVSDIKVRYPNKETAIVTSVVKVNLTAPDGTDANDHLRTTTIYSKRGKDWLIVYHSDVSMKM